MAATQATRRNAPRSNRNAARRGAHAPASHTEVPATEARAVTPAMHITPNVLISTRGDVRAARRERRGTPARSLRRFAV